MLKSLLARLSIRVTAPALLVLPVLIAAGVLVTIGTIQGRAAVNRLASQQLAQIHDQIGQHVDALVSLPARVDRANVALIDTDRFDPAAPRAWGPVLLEQFRAFEALSAITWGGEDGQCTWVARYIGDEEHLYYAVKDAATGEEIVEYRVGTDGVVPAEPSGSFAFDPRGRPWYVAPKVAGAPAWSEPFVWVGGGEEEQTTLGIAYGWPVFDDAGALIGIMDADLSLQDLSRYLAELRIGRTGRAYVIDEAGLMLASSTAAALVGDSGARRAAVASDQPWLAGSARYLVDTFGAIDAVDAAHDAIVELDGRREWLRASPFVHPTGLSWVVVTLVPESDFMAEISAGRRRSAWFTAGVTLGTIGLGILIAMLLVRPIVEISRHVRHLGAGELDRSIDLAYARELVNLSDDINQMSADLRDRLALRRSLALAMEVQQTLLPSETPRVAGLDIAGHSTYCDETGGDYYDYLDIGELSDHAVSIVVGDVMGHGIAAAMLMATARGILRSRCTDPGSHGELLGHLNTLLNEVTGGARFMTMVLITIDGQRSELRMSSAGHDPPFIYDSDADRFIELESSGLPLGIVHDETYAESTYGPLPPGTVIIASTDGVWEAQNDDREQFGKERIHAIMREHAPGSAEDIGRALHAAVRRFCGQARQLDDMTFVVVKRL